MKKNIYSPSLYEYVEEKKENEEEEEMRLEEEKRRKEEKKEIEEYFKKFLAIDKNIENDDNITITIESSNDINNVIINCVNKEIGEYNIVLQDVKKNEQSNNFSFKSILYNNNTINYKKK